jgi:hypothetical protein
MKIFTGFILLGILWQGNIHAQTAPKEPPPLRRPGLLVWGVDTVHDTIPGNCGCDIYFGVEAGIHINSFGQTVSGSPSLNNSSLLNAESASGISPKLGIVFDLPLRFSPALGLEFRMAYNWVSATSGGTQVGTYDLKKISDNTTVAGNVTTSYSLQTQVLDLALYLRYKFKNIFGSKNDFFLGAGPRVRIRTTPFLTTRTLQVVNNSQLGFPGTFDQTSSRVTDYGSDRLLRPGIDGILGYQYHLNDLLSFVLSAGGDIINFTPPLNDEVSLASQGGGDRARELSGQLSDLSFTSRKLSQYFITLGIWFSL